MGRLSLFSYVWKCVAGSEILYSLCVFAAFVLDRSTAEGTELHKRLFETMPGFVWLTPASIIIGAAYTAVFSIIFDHIRHRHGLDVQFQHRSVTCGSPSPQQIIPAGLGIQIKDPNS